MASVFEQAWGTEQRVEVSLEYTGNGDPNVRLRAHIVLLLAAGVPVADHRQHVVLQHAHHRPLEAAL